MLLTQDNPPKRKRLNGRVKRKKRQADWEAFQADIKTGAFVDAVLQRHGIAQAGSSNSAGLLGLSEVD